MCFWMYVEDELDLARLHQLLEEHLRRAVELEYLDDLVTLLALERWLRAEGYEFDGELVITFKTFVQAPFEYCPWFPARAVVEISEVWNPVQALVRQHVIVNRAPPRRLIIPNPVMKALAKYHRERRDDVYLRDNATNVFFKT